MKVKLYKNACGVLVYGEIYSQIPVFTLEDAYPDTIGAKLHVSLMKNLFKFNSKTQNLIDSLGKTFSS
jgi:hypothetical protein